MLCGDVEPLTIRNLVNLSRRILLAHGKILKLTMLLNNEEYFFVEAVLLNLKHDVASLGFVWLAD